jgi:hypothetical protein
VSKPKTADGDFDGGLPKAVVSFHIVRILPTLLSATARKSLSFSTRRSLRTPAQARYVRGDQCTDEAFFEG